MARRRLPPVGLILALLAGTAGPARAQSTDPYSSDPLQLIAYKGSLDDHALGTDTWEVWVCDVPDGDVALAPEAVAGALNSGVGSYFVTLSSGAYAPTFTAGGQVTASLPSGWPQEPFRFQGECESLVRAASVSAPNGAVIVVDAAYRGGYGTGGLLCEEGRSCPLSFPDNQRLIVLGAGAVVGIAGEPAALRTSAHEIGHALLWPHSFAGLIDFANGVVYEYDNPMDLMSGGDSDLLDIGTIAINRYAAGWLGTGSVMFHRGGNLVYSIGAAGGLQMVILPTDKPGQFEMVGVRTRSGADQGIPVEGVEVYRIEQDGAACGLSSASVCFGLDRRTTPVPAVADLAATAHVHGVGESFTVRGVTITVLDRTASGFTIRIEGAAVTERFLDDDGNLHEANIEAIAALGITRGCNPPLVSHYCPDADVTRAEMAAFLIAALGEQPAPTYSGYFPDVTAGQWYTGYVERLHELGITTGNADGTFDPGRALTRAEMAVFLTRALSLPAAAPGSSFADVGAIAWYAAAVEAIRLAGVTAGCSLVPSLYCPIDPVKRDQMATFVARSLGI